MMQAIKFPYLPQPTVNHLPQPSLLQLMTMVNLMIIIINISMDMIINLTSISAFQNTVTIGMRSGMKMNTMPIITMDQSIMASDVVSSLG
jgi:hypothetical protein